MNYHVIANYSGGPTWIQSILRASSSGGALYIMFENHVRSWPLLKPPSIREVVCLNTFVYMCILF